jgi:hypothetical protein
MEGPHKRSTVDVWEKMLATAVLKGDERAVHSLCDELKAHYSREIDKLDSLHGGKLGFVLEVSEGISVYDRQREILQNQSDLYSPDSEYRDDLLRQAGRNSEE